MNAGSSFCSMCLKCHAKQKVLSPPWFLLPEIWWQGHYWKPRIASSSSWLAAAAAEEEEGGHNGTWVCLFARDWTPNNLLNMLRFFFSHLHHISTKRDNNFTTQIFFSITAWKSSSPKFCPLQSQKIKQTNRGIINPPSGGSREKSFKTLHPHRRYTYKRKPNWKPKLRSERKFRKQLMMIKRILHAIKWERPKTQISFSENILMTNKQKPTCTHLLPEKQNQTKDALPDFFLKTPSSPLQEHGSFSSPASPPSPTWRFFFLSFSQEEEREGVCLWERKPRGTEEERQRFWPLPNPTKISSHKKDYPSKCASRMRRNSASILQKTRNLNRRIARRDRRRRARNNDALDFRSRGTTNGFTRTVTCSTNKSVVIGP